MLQSYCCFQENLTDAMAPVNFNNKITNETIRFGKPKNIINTQKRRKTKQKCPENLQKKDTPTPFVLQI